MIDLIIDIIFWALPILSIYSFCWAAWKRKNGEFIGSNDYRVYCPRCGARGNSHPDKAKAIEAWNRRADNA